MTFEYFLDIVPCKKCGSTSITLTEYTNTKESHEHQPGKATGGGICNRCGYGTVSYKLPPVPSMSMLLDVWNKGNV